MQLMRSWRGSELFCASSNPLFTYEILPHISNPCTCLKATVIACEGDWPHPFHHLLKPSNKFISSSSSFDSKQEQMMLNVSVFIKDNTSNKDNYRQSSIDYQRIRDQWSVDLVTLSQKTKTLTQRCGAYDPWLRPEFNGRSKKVKKCFVSADLTSN